MAYLTLLVALSISGVAAWYSIAGLAAIFSGAQLSIIIMGSVLEVGKLVTASWLYRNWKQVPILLKSYLTLAVIVLMLITSMGIYGYLSKAHLEQTINVQGATSLRIETLERQIGVYGAQIEDAEAVLAILDADVKTLQEYDRIRGPEGAIAVRQSQKEEREALNSSIMAAQRQIQTLQEELTPLRVEKLGQEAELGPLKYISELFYESSSPALLDRAVRGVIIAIIFVFDPLAVLLLIAANMTLTQDRNKITTQKVAVVEDTTGNFFEEERTLDELPGEGHMVAKSAEDRLVDVDKRLKEIYNAPSLTNKHEKRELERLRKKLISRIEAKRGK